MGKNTTEANGGMMKLRFSSRGRHSLFSTGLAAAVAAAFFCPASANASLIEMVQSATAAPGSSGNAFDVLLTNTGPSAITVGGFSFGISIANPSISFRDANTSTSAPYVFDGMSLFGPDLTGPTSGQSLVTSDVFLVPFAGSTLGAGVTVGLGHVLFDVAPGAAPGVFPVTLAGFPTTSLADATGANLAIQTLSAGQITITGAAAVPEPRTLATLFCGLALLAGCAGRRRRTSST